MDILLGVSGRDVAGWLGGWALFSFAKERAVAAGCRLESSLAVVVEAERAVAAGCRLESAEWMVELLAGGAAAGAFAIARRRALSRRRVATRDASDAASGKWTAVADILRQSVGCRRSAFRPQLNSLRSFTPFLSIFLQLPLAASLSQLASPGPPGATNHPHVPYRRNTEKLSGLDLGPSTSRSLISHNSAGSPGM